MPTGTLRTAARPRTGRERPEWRISPAALRLLDRLRAEAGEVVLLAMPDGKGEVLCFGRDDITPGPHHVCIATVRGCAVYVDRRGRESLGVRPTVLDVSRDLMGFHFLLRDADGPW